MKLWYIGACVAGIAAAAWGGIAVNGQPEREYSVVTAADASASELNAARELTDYLERITGMDAAQPVQPGRGSILVGQSPEAAAALGVDWAELAPDEICIKTLENGDIVIAGARPRGTLYAVSEFLEQYCQVRFWTSWETEIPRNEHLELPTIDLRYHPRFPVREAFLQDVWDNPEFARHCRFNGMFLTIPEDWGGCFAVIGGAHTFERWIPAGEYLETHPEFFSLIDGKRCGGLVEGQLCLTNPEVKALITAKALEELRKHPTPRIISVSQNDNRSYCRCDSCQASDTRLGGPAGTLLAFVNDVAAAIEQEFPAVMVETLAYQYTRQAPTGIRARSNVQIRLCSIECDFRLPLRHAANAAFAADLAAWSLASDHLAVWDYINNFSSTLVPFPTWVNFADNIRFFASFPVQNLFEQGEYQAGTVLGDLSALKCWLLAKLLWNPELDQQALTGEFLRGYYGAAAPQVAAYLELLRADGERMQQRMTIFRQRADLYLSVEAIVAARQLLAEAQETVSDDPVRSFRIGTLQAGVELAYLEAVPTLLLLGRLAELPETLAEDIERMITAFQLRKLVKYREFQDFIFLERRLRQWDRALRAERPEQFRDVPTGKYLELPAVLFSTEAPINGVADLGTLVEDPLSPAGSAFLWKNTRENWGLHYELSPQILERSRRWHLYVSGRGGNATPGQDGMLVGVHSIISGQTEKFMIPAEKLASEQYGWFDVGVFDFDDHSIIFVSAVNNPELGDSWFDRMVLVAE